MALTKKDVERYTVFGFGVLFLLLILALVVWIPRPTSAQFFDFRLAMALAAAGVGALIPGFFEFEYAFANRSLVRSGGAIALFAAVWFANPGKYAVDAMPPPPVAEATPVISRFLKYMDAGDHADAYSMLSHHEKAVYSEANYLELSKNVRVPLGKRVAEPRFGGVNNPDEIAGRKGPFVIQYFQSRFTNSPGVWVEAVGVVAEDGEWKMYSYNVGPCLPPACSPLQGV